MSGLENVTRFGLVLLGVYEGGACDVEVLDLFEPDKRKGCGLVIFGLYAGGGAVGVVGVPSLFFAFVTCVVGC